MATQPAPQTLQLTLAGKSGRTYVVQIYSLETEFNPVGAVYAVLRDDSVSWRIVYIGQTGALCDRFANHHHAEEFSRHRATHLGVIVINDKQTRCDIEADLVGHYAPPLNLTGHG